MEVLGKGVSLVIILLLLSSCLRVDCEENARFFRAVECLQIFEKLPTLESPYMKSEGIHLVTGDKCICEDETRALNIYKNILEKGDSIIKRKGELNFSIHKKDTIIEVKWECEGKVYE
ncbi:hypothetical protein [Flavobacterium sp. NKUCC04_CG]|uniref:hypothetical protein n=1 Tax=Flavobacterium sp. NKUCC04_CG TaxID=2842121 RepID=UPI001C5B1380|nr:hypothetical protein [Flavobacterium sp. NKUCC04_CG]MBW3519809.1 hypothetical protein [Flavobacterium sp. NKUCC04_CG]